MRFVHSRKYILRFFKDVKLIKSINVEVGLSREKDWTLEIPGLGISVVGNKINALKEELKERLYEIHSRFMNDTLEEELRAEYSKYYKKPEPIVRLSQREKIKIMREQHRENKKKNR